MSMCSQKYPGPDCTLNFEVFLRMSTIWSCGCGSVTWISPELSAWKSDGVDGMYRKTTRSTFAFGPAVNWAFRTSTICVPFCQLCHLNGPLATSIELRHRSLKF